jgi:hypothetical protein
VDGSMKFQKGLFIQLDNFMMKKCHITDFW